jgi:cellulose synthase operon protein YhjQ
VRPRGALRIGRLAGWESQMTECGHDAGLDQTPAEIAKLYRVASVPGPKYRDFSASRRETRAHFSHRLLEDRAVRARRAEVQPKSAPAPPSEPSQPPSAQIEAVSASQTESTEQPRESPAGLPPVAFPTDSGAAKRDVAVQANAVSTPSGHSLEPGPRLPSSAPPGARWFALKNIFFPEGFAGAAPFPEPAHVRETGPVTVLAVFSVAGGVGKTTLVATLGRALAAYGERVLLAETASFGLLPLYFGSREFKPGVVRIFSPPSASPDAPVHAVNLDPGQFSLETGEHDRFLEALLHKAHGSNRILVDISTASDVTMRRLLPLTPTVLVPILPDMNSVISLNLVETGLANQNVSGRPRIEPAYLLNHFDESLPLHADVRETLRQKLGSRLLPFVIHRSPNVSEALAEGMTVMDYAPDSAAAEDYLLLAGWLRSVSAGASGLRGARWSER